MSAAAHSPVTAPGLLLSAVLATCMVLALAATFAVRVLDARAVRALQAGVHHGRMVRGAARVVHLARLRAAQDPRGAYADLERATIELAAAALQVDVLHVGRSHLAGAHHRWLRAHAAAPLLPTGAQTVRR